MEQYDKGGVPIAKVGVRGAAISAAVAATLALSGASAAFADEAITVGEDPAAVQQVGEQNPAQDAENQGTLVSEALAGAASEVTTDAPESSEGPAAEEGDSSDVSQDAFAAEDMPSAEDSGADGVIETSDSLSTEDFADGGADASEAATAEVTAATAEAAVTADGDALDNADAIDAEDLPFTYEIAGYAGPGSYQLIITSVETTDLVIPAELFNGYRIVRVIASGLGLTSIDLSQCGGVAIDCSDNQLTSLDVNGATNVDCSNNQLTSLTGLGVGSASSLDCSYNNLTSLVLEGTWEYLYCNDNQLTELEARGPFYHFDCSNNNLSGSLSVTGHDIKCANNSLSSLNVTIASASGSLPRTLDCSNNQLTELNVTDSGGGRELGISTARTTC